MKAQLADLLNDAFKLATRIVGQPADAHDVIQDAAAIALTHKQAPDQQSHDFKPWFYRVVRNKAIDRIRADSRANARTVELPADNENEAGQVATSKSNEPPAHLLATQMQTHIETALKAVSVEHREIVLLKDYHGFGYEEIANILSIPKGTVMSKLHRARTSLRHELAKLAKGGE